MKTDFIPIDYDYFDFQGRNYAKIVGRNNFGKRICVIDSCPTYLWAILKDKVRREETKKIIDEIKKIQLDVKGRKTKVEKVELHEKNYLGKRVQALKIFATNYKDLHDVADHLGMNEIEKRRGYDLGFITHYIIEKKINPLCWYEISGEVLNNSTEFGGIDSNLDVDFCIKLESCKEIKDNEFHANVLAFDIETDELKIGEGEILMISLVSKNFQKVITWKGKEEERCAISSEAIGNRGSAIRGSLKETIGCLSFVEYVKDEAELLEKFAEYVKKISPDFLVGYFSDSFDLPYLKARAEKHNVKLSLGLDGSQPKFTHGINIVGEIKGIVHVDLSKFIRTAYSQYMQSETLALNEIAKEFLGDSKKNFKFRHSSKIDGKEWNEYYEYNLHDSFLTLKLFEKFWPDMLEFTRVIQEPIFDVSRNGMSKNVESYIIHNLEKFNEIPEKKPMHDEIEKRREREKYTGAFVFEPKPGIYEDLAVFDFTSYWPSIIVSFNLSLSTLLDKKEKNSLEVDIENKKVHFNKKQGFFPAMLKEIIELRKKYKEELKQKPDVLKKARSNAFKLLANASYGYQGFFGARYYCPEASAAATSISRDFIKKTIEKINKESYEVIYSDTDSIMLLMKNKNKSNVEKLLKKINSELPGIMELELEGFFKRGIWVTTRGGIVGAKKKYALISEDNKIKIRGFETVRRDWCKLARQTQNKVIRQILEDGNEKNALEYAKLIIKKMKERKIDREELIIRTQLKKPLSEYKAISPHVIAARKMHEQKIPISQGGLVEFYIAETKDKKKLVREKVKLPNEEGNYDIQYYLERQILPAVENIFHIFKVEIRELIDGKKQTTLGDF